MELVKRIYLNASNENHNREITKGPYFNFINFCVSYFMILTNIINTDFELYYCLDEFLYSTQVMSQITPLEVDILFTLCHLLHQRAG